VEDIMGAKFGDVENPCLLSVRSGARASMPGMMDTVLNLGLNDDVVQGLIKKTSNPRFVWDSYRRFIMMYGDVVMEMKYMGDGDHDPFELIIEEIKEAKGIEHDADLTTEDFQELVKRFKVLVKGKNR
jgi:pyruvate, orthophosphate dikinase